MANGSSSVGGKGKVSENQFADGGSILDQTRSSMSPKSVEVKACLDDG